MSDTNFRSVTKRPIVTDYRTYPPLRATLLGLVTHPDEAFLWGVVGTLIQYGEAPSGEIEQAFLTRLRREQTGRVRAQLIGGLTQFAVSGSSNAALAVRAAFDDRDVAVQLAAIQGMRRLLWADMLGTLVGKLSADSPLIRASAARTLIYYGPAVRPHQAVVEERIVQEPDEIARRALKELLSKLSQ